MHFGKLEGTLVRSFVPTVAALALILSAATLHAAPAGQLRPTSKWIVDYRDDGCVLQRTYGAASAPLTFGIKPQLMGSRVALLVTENGTGGHKLRVPVTVSFGTDSGAVTNQLSRFRLRSPPVHLNETSIEMNELKRAIVTERIDLKSPGTIDVRLAVPGIGRALPALEECIAELLDRWGLSRLEQAQLASFARPRGGQLHISMADYPGNAVEYDASGGTAARVKVAPDGKASDCQIVATSKSKSLDQATCKVLLRERYEPAVSKAGGPVASVYIQIVRWVLL